MKGVAALKNNGKTNESMTEALQKLPSVPNCAVFMRAEFIEYIPGEKLTFSFPVQDIYLNPAQSMQGGFITAAFDNVFGPLSLLEMKSSYTTTITLTTSYHRPIFAGDKLTVTAYIKNMGRRKIHMQADAFNHNKKLIATATCDYLLAEPD